MSSRHGNSAAAERPRDPETDFVLKDFEIYKKKLQGPAQLNILRFLLAANGTTIRVEGSSDNHA